MTGPEKKNFTIEYLMQRSRTRWQHPRRYD